MIAHQSFCNCIDLSKMSLSIPWTIWKNVQGGKRPIRQCQQILLTLAFTMVSSLVSSLPDPRIRDAVDSVLKSLAADPATASATAGAITRRTEPLCCFLPDILNSKKDKYRTGADM